MAISASLETRNFDTLCAPTGNIYESVSIMGRRARQIAVKVKEELTQKLAEFASNVDNLEEIFENKEQIEISKFYERMPKPTQVAIDEFQNGKLIFYYVENQTDTQE
ncbi:MAG: DNA-directed RNA polymerase subunit omega [Cytophagales bacterium]|nr:DNA-directed RNA polymerase subunit omega [Cytophagales bacterium]MDW8384809.1 DNA-directed RNA polymerase subunit omega [Flammeovirgaceae bacterium]